MQDWYNDMTRRQKILVYAVAICMMPFLLGIPAFLLLLYLEFGKDKQD